VFFGEALAIDFGTANIHVCVKGHGVVVREPSVIAFADFKRKPAAVGNEARLMLGRDVPGVEVKRPMLGGVLADFDAAVELLRHVIRAALGRRPLWRTTIVASSTSHATEVEKRALHDALREAGGGQIYLVPKSLAAGIGSGLLVDDAAARIVLDVGAGTTEIGVISMGAVVAGASLHYAGDDFDEAIRRSVKRKENLPISSTTAEELKVQAGAVAPDLAREPVRLQGLFPGTDQSQSSQAIITDIPEILARAVGPIVGELRWIIEELPPERRADVMQNGIVLTGGCALLRGLDALMASKLGVPVVVAKDPLSCTILGLEAILEDLGRLSLQGQRYVRTGSNGVS
jgi:rod shape-determining protein MreB